MIVVERTFTVETSPTAAIAYLTDFGNTQEWDRAAQHTVRNGTGPLRPGATWRQACRIFGITAELTWTLIEATGERLVFHGRNEGATCTDTVLVRPAPGGTEVTYRVELEMHGLAKLAAPVMKIEFEKLGTESASGLSQALNRLSAPAWRPSAIPPPAPA
jgi:polyketide cyclase/dehydrase/lipid transport protein